MRFVTDLLMHNKQGVHLAELQAHHGESPHHALLSVVVHCVVVFTHTQQIPFLKPFFNLIYDPASMKVHRYHLIHYFIDHNLESLFSYYA